MSAHGNAWQKTGLIMNVAAALQQNIYQSPAAIGGGKTDPLKEMPTLAKLFGSMDMCECQHCRSVYGPAAYFVDLLQFLRKSNSTLYTRLTKRRPDLPYIELSCENSQTPLPYLDLVNEILEYFVLHNGLEPGLALAKDTVDISAEELSVNPQYTLEDAYEVLKSAVHSFRLPFNRPLEVARVYLEHLGSSRHEVMAAFQNQTDGTPSQLALALEYLKISPDEYDVLIGAPIGKEPREFFGWANSSTNKWKDDLRKVPEFLRRTGVAYADVVELLKTRHVNPGQTLATLPDDLIVLFSPDSTCDLSQTRIQHWQAPLALADEEWLKLHRFLRLWKKLGWTLQELDKTLQAVGASTIDDALLLDLARVQRMRTELNLPIVRLLSFWASIDVFGKGSLYDNLFQNRAVINPVDGAFTLSDPPAPPQIVGDGQSEMTLAAHVPAIAAALRINAEDFTRLREAAGLSADDAPLTLENLSTFYRHSLLARALKLKIRDLLDLMVLLGVNPAQVPTPAETEAFVERLRRAKSSDFTLAQLNYLYRHLFDATKKTAPLREAVILLLQRLQEALRKIIDETALVPDPLGDVLRAKLSLAIDPTLTDAAIGIIEKKPPATVGEQQQNEAFIEMNFAAFLDPTEAKLVLVHSPDLSVEEKRAYVFAPLLAHLRRSFSRSLVNERLSDALPLKGALTQLYLETVLESQTGSGNPAIEDFLALVGDGLSAKYFDNQNLNGLPVLSRVDPNVSFYWGEGSPNDLIPAESFSASWEGLLVVQHDENFTFYARAKDGVRVWVDGLVDPIIDAWQDQTQAVEDASEPVPLLAGHAYPIRIEYYANGPLAGIELSWSSLSTPKSVVPQSQLYSGANFVPLDGLLQSYYRLHKIAVLANNFHLTPEEAAYFSAHGSDFANFDVNGLPLERTDQTDDNAANLFKSWERLRDYVALRDKLPASDAVKLLDLLAALPTEIPSLLATMTGWSEDDINFLFLPGPDGLGLPEAAFKNADGLTGLRTAFAISERLGVAVKKLRAWARDAASKEQAKEIIHTVKARYDAEQWLAAAKPLNDVLRERQRDALVAYLLAHEQIVEAKVADVNRLFEYLLIDVAMNACMMTSRLKQAISSVQLFIHRVLMNLEENLSPVLLDRRQWDWMKNYRVWEANRKVFLYPENWIEPELRDDKSPFFKDLENQLLQNEITNVNVEEALLSYLHRLDEVSRLEISGVYREHEGGVDLVHVFGRTNNTPPVHYYRRYDIKLGVWTPWEKMSLDIESDPIIPVIWNRRLYVFWPTFSQKPDEEQPRGGPNLIAENATLNKWLQDKEAFDTSRGRREQWGDARDAWETLRAKLADQNVATVDGYSIETPSLEQDPGPLANADHEWVLNKEAYDLSSGRRQEWPKGHDQWEDLRSALKEADEDISIYDYPVPLPAQAKNPGPHPTADVEVPPPAAFLEIKLSWGEYRQNRWSPKKTARTTLKSMAYTTGKGEKKLPQPIDHRFEATIAKGGGLFIWCFGRRKKSADPVYLDYAAIVGLFAVGGCQDEMVAYPPLSVAESEFLTPDHSRMAFMRFDEQAGDALAFYGPKPALDKFLVLKNTPTGYRLAHPPYSIEPKAGGFAHVIYPFGYQDIVRSYIALPALDAEPPSRVIGKPAKPQIQVGLEDALINQIFIDKGDPAPDVELVTNPQLVAEMTSSSGLGGDFGLAFGAEPSFLKSASFDGVATAEAPAAGALPSVIASTAGQSLIQLANAAAIDLMLAMRTYLKFHIFYHPHVCELVRRLNRDGIPGFMARESQQLTNEVAPAASLNNHGTVFYKQYKPTADVHWRYPLEDVDFRQEGAYSIYNWELFFHAPLLIADRLSRNQRFQDAQAWFHLIFDPTADSDLPSPGRYWKTLPFFENSHPEKQQIVTLLKALDPDSPDKKTRDDMNKQVALWRTDPFKPHLIARMRVTAYQKTVVMKYIDNLIAWGDQLFGRDTIESINEATQLYILAYNILGPRPEDVPTRGKIVNKTYTDLIPDLDSFSNAIVEMENEFPFDSTSEPAEGDGAGANDGFGTAPTFYFCIPRNEKLLGYWDTVEDRLFKIRHCMNIQGIVRELPLFEPPIDPALLVKATAMGLDLSSALNDINSPLPCYRFSMLAQKAAELCSELKSLGGLLLSTLERKDAEELAALRTGHETVLLKAVREMKKSQIQEAKINVAALERSWDVVEERRSFYDQALLLGLNAYEQAHLDKLKAANDKQAAAMIYELSAQGASNIPDITAGTSGTMGSPVLTAIFGGKNLVSAFQAYARYLNGEASDASYQAGKSAIEGANRRRGDDWKLQKNLATKELMQIDRQITAGQVRVAIAERDLENHDKQIENNLAIEEFLRNKYTNQELYGWMLSQVSAVYFQTYKLAYDAARRAERAYRFERGVITSNFIQFGYWDSLRRGLLAGESLHLDIKRMEMAYLDQNKREYELTKHISLRALDPRAFLTLKETGRCFIELSETVFDRDYPGHYMRRIKNVSLTIPCVIGPYTNVNATLTLLSSKTRLDPNAQRPYPEEDADDPRFLSQFGALQSIATSTGQNDGGLFELNFRDERYLPFEGAGAVSKWRLDMPKACNAFDYDTISEVVLRISYTAREGGDLLRQVAMQALQPPDEAKQLALAATLTEPDQIGLARLFSARHEFPSDWYRFLHPADAADKQILSMELSKDRFAFQPAGKTLELNSIDVFLKLREGFVYQDDATHNLRYAFRQIVDDQNEQAAEFPDKVFKVTGSPIPALPHAQAFEDADGPLPLGRWSVVVEEKDLTNLQPEFLKKTISVNNTTVSRLNPDAIDDLWFLCRYSTVG